MVDIVSKNIELSRPRLLHFILFTDDMTIVYSDEDWIMLESKLNSELWVVADWFRVNRLSLNISKTNFIAFYGRRCLGTSINITIDNTQISEVVSTKFLDIQIDTK